MAGSRFRAGPVGALIAAGILVSAAHAIRPPSRAESRSSAACSVRCAAWRSLTLDDVALSTSQLVISLLGFTLGIQLVQLLVVAVTLPALVLLACADRAYRVVRIGGACTAAVAALGVLLDRLGRANPVAVLADSAGGNAWWVVAGLWLAAIVVALRRRRSRSSRSPGAALTVEGEFTSR